MDQNNRMEALKRKYGLSQPTNIYSDRRLGTYNVEKDEEEERKRKEQQLLDAKVESVSELSRQDRETPKFDTPRTSMHQKYTDFGRDLKEDVTKVTAERRAMGMSDDEIDDSLIPRTQTDEVTKRLQKIKENIKPGSESLPYQVKEGWMEKEVMNILSSEAVKAMNGKENKMDEVQAFMDANPELQMSADSNFFEQGVRFLGELPRQLRDSTEFAIKDKESWLVAAAVFGAGAALTAATGGAALPMVATTLGSSLAALAPAAAAGIGMSYGSMKHMANLEGGLAYNEYVQDPSVHPDIARQVAMTVGSMNGVVEFLEIGGVLSGIPGSAVAKKLALDKVKKEMAQRALRVGAAYGVNLGSNVLEEVIQESNTSLGMAYAKALSESMKDAPNPNTMAGLEALRKTMTTEEYRDRLGETAIQTLRSMWLAPIATGGIRTAGRQASTALENRAKQKAIKGWYTQEEAMTNSALAEQKKVLLDDNGAVDMLAGNVRNQKDQKSYSYLVSMEPFLKDVLTRSDLTNEERSILVDKLNVINEAISEVEFAAKEGQNDINLAPTSMEEVRQSVLSGEVDRQVLTNDAYIEKYNESVDNGIAEMVREMKSEKKTISEINEAIQKKLPKKQRNAVEANLIRRSIDLVDQETKIQRNLNLIRNFDSVKHLLEENEATEQAQTSETEVVDTNGQTEEQSPSMDVTEPLNDTQTQTETEQVQNTKYEQPKGDIEVVEGKYKPSDTVKVPTGEINIDPKRFQFRFDGTTDKLAGTEWNDNLSGTVLLWENEYGDLYVVNGHHRVSLAQENSIVELDAKILSGVTEQEARAQGALLNIAEGSATSIDVAKYMRDTNTTLEQMQEYGIAPKSKIARDGDALSNLDDGLFKLAATRQIPIERATMIGREFGDDKPAQRSFLKSLMDIEAKGKTLTNDVIQEMIAQEKGMVQESFTEQTLLGEEENTKSLRVERAEVVSYVKDQLRQKKSLLKNVSQKKNAEVLESVGNKIDTEKSMAEMTLAEQALFLLDKTLNQVGTMTNKMFNDFAKQYAKGDKITIKKQALNAFIEAMESGEVLEEAFGKKTASQQATEALTQDNIPGQADMLGNLSQIKKMPNIKVVAKQGTNKATRDTLMPLIEIMEKNPIFNGLEIVFNGQESTKFMDRSELDAKGYYNNEPGNYTIYGWFRSLSRKNTNAISEGSNAERSNQGDSTRDRGRDNEYSSKESYTRGNITLTNSAKIDTLLHEAIHSIQDIIERIDPEFAVLLKEWESEIFELAKEQGITLPKGKEMLAHALMLGEFGYADDNYTLARTVAVPPEITAQFRAMLGKEFVNEAKGDKIADPNKKLKASFKKLANGNLKNAEITETVSRAKQRRLAKIKMQLRDNQTVTYYSPDTTTYAIAVPKDTQYEVSIFNEKGLLAKAEMAAEQLANKLSEMGLYFNPQEVSYQLKQFNRTQADEVYKGESVRIFKALQNARVGNFTAKDYDTTFTGKLNQRESDDILTNILIAATKGFDKLNSEITFTEYRNRFYSDRSPNELRARVVDGKTEVYYRDFTGYEPRTPDARVPEVSLGIYDSAEDAIGAHRDVPLHQRAEYISETDIQAEYEDFKENYETYREDFTEEFDGQIKFNVSYQLKNEAEEGSFTKYLNDNNAIDVEGRKTIYDPSINYQLKESAVDVEGFYSNLERVLDDKLGSRGKATDILNMLNKNGVKPEEMEWFRIAEFLEGKDMVTKEEILDHMQERRVEFYEKDMGGDFRGLTLHGQPGNNYKFNAFVYNNNPGNSFKVQKHFGSTRDVIAHTRYTDRATPMGERVLFIEELQSDWHQKGRSEGYAKSITSDDIAVKYFPPEVPEGGNPDVYPGYWESYYKDTGEMITRHSGVMSEDKVINEAVEWGIAQQDNFPAQAPLSNSITDFMFKTAIRDAVKGGYDRISWTTGEQQADRYDMRKVVDQLEVLVNPSDQTYEVYARKEGTTQLHQANMTEKDLVDTFGKEIANNIINDAKPTIEGFKDYTDYVQLKTYEGLDLETGGEFHKKLYDSYIPRMIKKYAKQWGIRPEVVEISDTNILNRMIIEEYGGVDKVIYDTDKKAREDRGRVSAYIEDGEVRIVNEAEKIAPYQSVIYYSDGGIKDVYAEYQAAIDGYEASWAIYRTSDNTPVATYEGTISEAQAIRLAIELEEADMMDAQTELIKKMDDINAINTTPITQQLSIPVTPQMIEDVMTQGQPLFQVKTQDNMRTMDNLNQSDIANLLKLGYLPEQTITETATGRPGDVSLFFTGAEEAQESIVTETPDDIIRAIRGEDIPTPISNSLVERMTVEDVQAVVLPNDVDNEIVTGLQQNGIHLIEFYDKNVEGDRTRAVNEILGKNDVSFQVKKTDTNTENFKKWFSDSKVVDREGNPLIVYHGTQSGGFSQFNIGDVGVFFTSDRTVASGYAYSNESIENLKIDTYEQMKDYLDQSYMDIYQEDGEYVVEKLQGVGVVGKYKNIDALREDFSRLMKEYGEIQGIYQTYLNIQNPLVVKHTGSNWNDILDPWYEWDSSNPYNGRSVPRTDTNSIAVRARAEGYDGVIFENVMDNASSTNTQYPSTVYVAFSPNQVKSVYNSGAWSAETADMYYQIKDEQSRDFDYRSWTQTVADGQITSPELRALLLSKEFIYEVAHNEDSLMEAARLIEKYGVEYIKEKLDKPVEVGANIMAAGEILTFAYMNQGDTVSAMEMTASMAKKATTMGQGIQILSQWNKQTPTGMLRFVQREFEKLTTKKQKAQVETATGDLTKKAIDINKKAVDKVDVVGAVETVKNLTQEEQNQRKAAKDDKTTTDYVQGTFIDGVPKTEMDTAAIVEIIKEHYKGNGKQNLFNTLVAKGLNEIEAKLLADTVKQQMKDFTAEEMQIAIDETVKGRAEAVDTQMKDLLAEGRYGEALKQMVGQKKNVPVLTSDMVDMIYKRGQEIQQMPTGREKDVETHKLWRDVSEQMPVPKGNKISTFHTMMMLLNFKTIARNLIGNDMFRRLDTFVLNTLGASIDKVYSEMNHTQRTTLLRLRDAHKQQRLGYKDGWTTGLEDALLGIDTSSFSNKFELKAKRSFDRNSAVGKLETVLNIGLRATDRAAVMASYFDSIAEQMQIEGVTEATPQMHERALQLGLYRTFNDETQLSNLFSEAKKTLNIIGLPNRSFGLGDLVLKFPRTPANIMARALDYSPAGLALTIKKIAAEADPYIKQRTVVEGISRAIAGSGVIAIGAQLAIMGILTGSEPDEDKDLYELQKQSGLREFSVNLSAITRWFSGEKNAGELRRGDTLGSYDWAQPLSMPLAIGADTVSGNTEALDFISTVVRSAEAGVTTLIEQPLMTGIANLFRYADPAQGFTNAFRGLPASFSPGIISQVAQAIDGGASNPYSYYSESRQAWNMMANKWIGDAEFNGLPLGRGAIPDRIGVMGEEERWFGDDALPIRLAKSMLSPMILSQYMPSEEAEFLIDLYEASGNPDVIPNSPQRQYTVYNRNDEKMVVKPTPEQFVEWSRWLGENTTKDIASAMRYGKNWSTEDLADEIKYLIGERGDELKERIEDEIY